MDEFEKIRAFSEQMSQKTEQALKQETTEEQTNETSEDNPDFLREWSHQEETPVVQKSLNKAFWGVFTLTTLVLICLVGVVYLLLREPMDNQEVVPTIAPTPVPVKVKPENPGGMVIPDQDKVIYDRVSQDPVPVKVEKLFPDEEPVLPPVEENPEIMDVDEPVEVPVIVEVKKEEVVEPEPAKPEVKTEQKVEQKVVQVEPQKEVKTVVQTPAEVWHAQLISSTDKAKVEKIWKTILAKHKGLLSDMPMNIVRADIAGKGTFYRLQVGDFATKERAANLCAKLIKQKQECMPAK